MLTSKKSQIWYVDFMVSVMIFVIVIIIYFQYINNLENQDQFTLNEMMIDANYIANSLVSQGYPESWNSTYVERIGLTNNDHRINFTKLASFMSLDYNLTRQLFGTSHHYYISFKDKNNTAIVLDDDDKIMMGYYSNQTDFLIKRSRLLIYNHSIVRMEVSVWH